MPQKIDVSTIDGYDTMTADEKVAALEAYEYNDNSDELSKYKNAVSKANSEAAEYKRQLKDADKKLEAAQAATTEGQSEAEKKLADLEAQLETMQHEKAVSDYTARFVSAGYDGELAGKAAAALADGEIDTVFDTLNEFIKAHDKAVKADLAQHSIAPNAGNTNPDKKTQMTKAKFQKLSPGERARLAVNDPEAYAELSK